MSELLIWVGASLVYLAIGVPVGGAVTRSLLADMSHRALPKYQAERAEAAFLGLLAMVGWPLVLMGLALLPRENNKQAKGKGNGE